MHLSAPNWKNSRKISSPRCNILQCHLAISPYFLYFLFICLWMMYTVICNNSVWGDWMLLIWMNFLSFHSCFLAIETFRMLVPESHIFRKRKEEGGKRKRKKRCFTSAFVFHNFSAALSQIIPFQHSVSTFIRDVCLLFSLEKTSADEASKTVERENRANSAEI